MASQTIIDKMKLRRDNGNLWPTERDYRNFICACLWGPSVSYLLRRRALYNDMSRYVCCAGYFPCSGRCGESRCPEFCLWTEVCLCFGHSVASTRFMLQDEFNIGTTECDNCIIGFMLCLQQFDCIFNLVAMIVGSRELSDAAQIFNCLAFYFVYCVAGSYMQTQHDLEMDRRHGALRPQVMAVPPVQQMSRLDQPYPPTVGLPPQQSAYPPPPQPQSYPPPESYPPPIGYPPASYFPPIGYPPVGYPPLGGYLLGYPPPGGYPPAGYPPLGGYPPTGYPPTGYPPPAAYPPTSYPLPGPPVGYPPTAPPQPQGYPPPADYPLPGGHPPAGYPPR